MWTHVGCSTQLPNGEIVQMAIHNQSEFLTICTLCALPACSGTKEAPKSIFSKRPSSSATHREHVWNMMMFPAKFHQTVAQPIYK